MIVMLYFNLTQNLYICNRLYKKHLVHIQRLLFFTHKENRLFSHLKVFLAKLLLNNRKEKIPKSLRFKDFLKIPCGILCGEGGIFRSLSRLTALLRTLAPFRSLPCGVGNSPPDCFSAPFKSLQNKTKKPYFVRLLCFGGEGALPLMCTIFYSERNKRDFNFLL